MMSLHVLYLQKMVLKVAIEDEKRKRRAMRAVAAVEGKYQSNIVHCNSHYTELGFK